MNLELSALKEEEIGNKSSPNLYVKLRWIFEFMFILMLIPLLIPLVSIIGLIIKLDSPGSVFFFQKRVGLRGKSFNMIKFGSMKHQVVCLKDDTPENKITHFGNFIRRHRINEIPQLFNVLTDKMSIIGPRPETVKCFKEYDKKIQFYYYRNTVLPGLTGWAQTQYRYTDDLKGARKKLEYDMYYLQNMSLKTDLRILIDTCKTVISGRGAK